MSNSSIIEHNVLHIFYDTKIFKYLNILFTLFFLILGVIKKFLILNEILFFYEYLLE
jgi:hypothetical protein